MYKHILVPVDGSKLATKAIRTAMTLAAESGAKVTLFYAAPDFGGVYYSESPLLANQYTQAGFRATIAKHAEKLLEQAARQAKGEVRTRHVISDYPYEAIVNAAAKEKCDLIAMASHGRRGVSGLLLGSETHKVLTHTKLPVLVVR